MYCRNKAFAIKLKMKLEKSAEMEEETNNLDNIVSDTTNYLNRSNVSVNNWLEVCIPRVRSKEIVQHL